MSLFPNSRAVVIGLPPSFDIRLELASAKTIRLATAFAHWAGWQMLSDAILACEGEKSLMAGSSFFQTEPKVLREWLELKKLAALERHFISRRE